VGSVPFTVQFSSAGSSVPIGTINSYSWSFGDGGTSVAANPTHTYYVPGNFTARLTVTDSRQLTASDAVSIVVGADPGTVLLSTAVDLSASLTGGYVSVTGTVVVKSANGDVAPGAVVSATWAMPGGARVTQSATTNASGIATFTTSGTPGTYTLTISNITKASYTFDPARSVLSNSLTKLPPPRKRPVRAS
jgi:PKD repeat protein